MITTVIPKYKDKNTPLAEHKTRYNNELRPELLKIERKIKYLVKKHKISITYNSVVYPNELAIVIDLDKFTYP